jgi:DNA-directed RNA polymerase subunit beta'
MSRNQLIGVLCYERYLVLDPGNSSYKIKDLINEEDFRKAKAKFPDLDTEIGGLAIKNLLQKIDLKKEYASLLNRTKKINANQEQYQLIIKKLKIVKWFIDTKTKPEWIITDVIPVIPPYLRPSIDPLGKNKFTATDLCYFRTEGKWFVVSGLNIFYEEIINSNNRLGRLIKLHAPDVIIRNERKMLQERVHYLYMGIVNRNNFLKWFFKTYDPKMPGLSTNSASIITRLPSSSAVGSNCINIASSRNIYLDSIFSSYS